MPDEPPYPGVPRWVKVFATIAVLIVLLLVVLMLGRGDHGPRHHFVSTSATHSWR